MKVAVVGATGMVGRVMLEVLEERKFPVTQLIPVASEASVGKKVVFGATVTLEDTDSGEKQVLALVGEHEADIKSGRMGITAPLARALIGREEGDVVSVRTPKGEKEYEVVSVRFVSLDSAS